MKIATGACGRTIGATVCMLLADLAGPAEEVPPGLRSDIVAAVDSKQLWKFILEMIEARSIHPHVPLLIIAKATDIESKPTADGRYQQVTLRRDAHLTPSQQETLRRALLERIEEKVLHYSSDRRSVSMKSGRAISELARELAEHDATDPSTEVTALEENILASVQSLIDARAIWPRIARTGEPAPRTEVLDAAWEINHRDLERIIHYSRLRHAHQRLEYLDELAGCYDDGRYTLAQAAEAIAESSGENYKVILQQLKLAVIDGKVPTYGRGSGLRYRKEGRRTDPSQVSQFDEQAIWSDVNQWLAQDSRIKYRLPLPNLPDPASIDSAATTPGVRALIGKIEALESNTTAAQAEAPPPAQQAWPWQEDQIIRTAKALGYDPVALPPDDRKKNFYVKSVIRERCAKNHPTKMRKALFDKAWERMMGSTPPTLKYAK